MISTRTESATAGYPLITNSLRRSAWRAGLSLRAAATLVGEVPAGSAVGLGAGHADGGVQCEPVQVPWRGARARRDVRGRERVALHRSRPAARAVHGRHTLQSGRIS